MSSGGLRMFEGQGDESAPHVHRQGDQRTEHSNIHSEDRALHHVVSAEWIK